MKIEDIIAEALRTGTDITPDDRKEWALFACALKVLGYDESDFIALSALHGTNERECRKVWRSERSPRRYVKTDEQAEKKIAYFAKRAGMNLKNQGWNDATRRTQTRRKRPQAIPIPPPLPPVVVPRADVAIASEKAPLSALFNFLCRCFPTDEVSRVFRKYHVGTTQEFGNLPGLMGTAFPYIDRSGRCIDVKLMAYDTTGHRRKNGYSANWYLAKRKMSGRRAAWPLFGEHLLNLNPSAPVGVVESEKTTLIASIALPGYLWVATGSKQNLNPERCRALKGRAVFLFPDADGVEEWNRRGLELVKAGFSIHFCNEIITDNALNPGDDIADIILHRLWH
ncbi:MAG: hypothetical protein HDS33_07620 [Bacteroides sp.]|nr:hypothetical protein [Bacteroides sp.]